MSEATFSPVTLAIHRLRGYIGFEVAKGRITGVQSQTLQRLITEVETLCSPEVPVGKN